MNKTQLVLHCGGHNATLEEVSAVTTPSPDGIWHPIPHRLLYDQVVTALATLNMRVVNEQHALARGGLHYFALMQVGNCRENQDYAYIIGLRGSLDKAFAASLAVGSGVFVCDNLAFSGEITIARKYTTYIERDLPVLTSRAVGKLSESWTRMDERFNAYKGHELGDAKVHDLLIRSLDVGATTTTQLPHVLEQWRKPAHPEFAERKNVWRLFNAFTEVAKRNSVFQLPARTRSLHALLDSECGLASKEESITAGTADATVNINN